MKTIQDMIDIQQEIIAIFQKHNLSHKEGEFTLLFLAGVSAGVCQRPILHNSWVDPCWLGWTHGAKHEPINDPMAKIVGPSGFKGG